MIWIWMLAPLINNFGSLGKLLTSLCPIYALVHWDKDKTAVSIKGEVHNKYELLSLSLPSSSSLYLLYLAQCLHNSLFTKGARDP